MRQKFLAGKWRTVCQLRPLFVFASSVWLEILARVDRTIFYVPTLSGSRDRQILVANISHKRSLVIV